MKKNIIILHIFLFILSMCQPVNKYPPEPCALSIEEEGAWAIYSMNYVYGDTLIFHKVFPDKKHADLLTMNVKTLCFSLDSLHQIVGLMFLEAEDPGNDNPLTFECVTFDKNKKLVELCYGNAAVDVDSVYQRKTDSLFIQKIGKNTPLSAPLKRMLLCKRQYYGWDTDTIDKK